MRDWNVVATQGLKQVNKSVAYLWGIEIDFYSLTFFCHRSSVAYLWGIEIRQREVFVFAWSWSVAYLWGIEIPKVLIYDPLSQYSSVAYLWGIEIGVCRRQIPWLFLSVAYLWGIEIGTFTGTWTNVELSVAYLWGIEILSRNAGTGNAFVVCSLPMRDWNLTIPSLNVLDFPSL